MRDDDKLVFSDETTPEKIRESVDLKQYKLLIVDDEKEVHVMTKLVLSDYTYNSLSLQFFSAYSSDEAKKMIQAHPDAACILLDVVMETRDAGLEIARFIREVEKNSLIRIILRTGQPGKAPEKDVILNYDINDYKEKTELTTQKLFTCITTALRSHNHLIELEEKRKEIVLKNERLNEEIAKRIVAEHNLTKYNRSLERILENKTARLKTSLDELKKTRRELQDINLMASLGQISTASLSGIDYSSDKLADNIKAIKTYQDEMSGLLDKYQMLQDIIRSHTSCSPDELVKAAQKSIEELDQFKKNLDYEAVLEKYPQVIEDSSKDIKNIAVAVADIKLFLCIDEESKKEINLNRILTSSLDNLKQRAGKSVEIHQNLNDLPNATVTPKQMGKALDEIFANALNALDDKGIIYVSSSYETPDILISISDTGKGIEQEKMEQIFNPYFTDRENAKGLGLTFAKAVIRNNAGSIEASSRSKEGTTIVIRLPEVSGEAL